VPGQPKPSGFTITSPPSKASPSSSTAQGYLELAVQKYPENPPAVWLWLPEDEILGAELRVRVGGSFVWPPAGVEIGTLERLVFVAGGLGLNPLMSMLSHIAEAGKPCLSESCDVRFLYSVKIGNGEELDSERILFLERLTGIFTRQDVRGNLSLFFTGGMNFEFNSGTSGGVVLCNAVELPFLRTRIGVEDIAAAVGEPEQRLSTVVYVCGPPAMTDGFVDHLTSSTSLAMHARRVKFEKWW
jgi:ferredoxin-NADP reductase